MKVTRTNAATLACILLLLDGHVCLGDPAARGKNAIEHSVPGTVPIMIQPNPRACWATTAAIMLQWRAGLEIDGGIKFTPEDAARLADENRPDKTPPEKSFSALLANERGLFDTDKPAFLKSLGLKAEWPANYTVKGWLDLLQTYGLLWVTTEAAAKGQVFVHAQVVKGLVGDGSYAGTSVIFIDPMDGKEHRENLVAFAQRYETVIIKDTEVAPDLEPRFQVLHFAPLPKK